MAWTYALNVKGPQGASGASGSPGTTTWAGITDVPAVLANNDFGRLVWTSAAGGTSASDGADTWTKIATFTGPSGSRKMGVVGLTVSEHERGATYLLSVRVNTPITGNQNFPALVTMIAGSAMLVDPVNPRGFLAVSDTATNSVALWVKKSQTGCKFVAYESSRMLESGLTITYESSPAWQSASPGSGAYDEGVMANGSQVLTENNEKGVYNKYISFADNTLDGTKEQFNAALSDGDFVFRSVNTINANTTLGSAASTDYIYYAVNYGNGTTLTLPAAANNSNSYVIFTRSSSNYDLTITRSGSDTIEGATSITVKSNTVTKLMSNGSDKWKNLSPGVLQ